MIDSATINNNNVNMTFANGFNGNNVLVMEFASQGEYHSYMSKGEGNPISEPTSHDVDGNGFLNFEKSPEAEVIVVQCYNDKHGNTVNIEQGIVFEDDGTVTIDTEEPIFNIE